MDIKERILTLLRERGELTTSELVELLNLPRHRVLRMLNKLYFEGLVEPYKKNRRYYWRLASGYAAIAPIHLSVEPVLYIEGIVEPIYRRVEDRIDSFIFTHVRNKEYWLCDCDVGYYILTDEPIIGCNCKLRHAFGDRKLAMLYLPKELRFRYWRSYRYGEGDVEFIILLPEERDSPELQKKFETYLETR
ncbi:winged helix-turn-helix domain-containing protein [Pyrobaculum aerophilum]|uniref:P. aerophilum family 453, possible regulatory protein n=2 Tax=Pyrobaculum aerophilum TaxID=13773 RepID=Q8ZWU8_PYRAE|nr:winged helix-turn-helix domain-containing protein [Pyrobaculum aerophilum]AAL63601.1 P. aerophilum family 453, possible regulatory protein [Pyrobaculum aerophilum str. IM2]MCX8136486.1 winged helix-turn-helix domain-containing protein [Pyrobaculum aerophilum]HII46472.1 winged helix-turn-helix transcriptional regulator [Pyrobaculum aerophilum]